MLFFFGLIFVEFGLVGIRGEINLYPLNEHMSAVVPDHVELIEVPVPILIIKSEASGVDVPNPVLFEIMKIFKASGNHGLNRIPDEEVMTSSSGIRLRP